MERYGKFLSRRSMGRKQSAIRALLPLVNLPGMISLGGGMPNPSLFPFKSMQIELKTGGTLTIDEKAMAAALQYGATPGLAPFLAWLRREMTAVHHPPYPEFEFQVSTGSQDALSKAFEMLLDDGDTLLTENPTYSGALAHLSPMNIRCIGLPIDGFGLVPDALADTLDHWDAKHPGMKKPKVLYCIPTGQNPSGASLTLERKQQIYAICSRHDLIILEDDPYWYLWLEDTPQAASFFSMDVDKRVLRFDSMSKILGAGLRVGWVTGPAFLIERIGFHFQSTSLHTDGLSQTALVTLLERWGEQGWREHIRNVQREYRRRRDLFAGICTRHLAGLAEFCAPSAGMFLWIKTPLPDTNSLIMTKARDKKVLMLPGLSFSPVAGTPSPYVRAAFSTATEQDMETAISRFAELLRDAVAEQRVAASAPAAAAPK